MLGDWYEFEYRLDHHCHVTLYYVFHSMSLACFLPRVFCYREERELESWGREAKKNRACFWREETGHISEELERRKKLRRGEIFWVWGCRGEKKNRERFLVSEEEKQRMILSELWGAYERGFSVTEKQIEFFWVNWRENRAWWMGRVEKRKLGKTEERSLLSEWEARKNRGGEFSCWEWGW